MRRGRGYLPPPDECDTADEQRAYYAEVDDALVERAVQRRDAEADLDADRRAGR